jgi:hypothetical protein
MPWFGLSARRPKDNYPTMKANSPARVRRTADGIRVWTARYGLQQRWGELLGPVEDAPTEEWERMVDLNVKGLL